MKITSVILMCSRSCENELIRPSCGKFSKNFCPSKMRCIQGYHDINSKYHAPFPPNESSLNYLYRGRQMKVNDNPDMSLIPPENKSEVEQVLAKRFKQNADFMKNMNRGMFLQGGNRVDPNSFGTLMVPDEIVEQPKIAIFDPPSYAYTPMLENFTPNNKMTNDNQRAQVSGMNDGTMGNQNIMDKISAVPLQIGESFATIDTDTVSNSFVQPITWVLFFMVLVAILIFAYYNR